MEISEQLLCLFSAEIKSQDGSHVVEVPAQELELGALEGGETYQIAILPGPDKAQAESEPDSTVQPQTQPQTDPHPSTGPPKPPVEEGEVRKVEIEDIGEQGDGITRVERGYVVIVPDTEMGERVEIEITDVRENVAFAEVKERISYYE